MEIEEAIIQLESVRKGVWFSLGAYAVLSEPESAQSLLNYSIDVSNEKLEVKIRSENHTFPEQKMSQEISFEKVLENNSARKIVDIAIMHMISKSFDAIQELKEKNKVELDQEALVWYEFARHIRNAFSHNFRWYFNKKAVKSLKEQPIIWRSMEINAAMNNQPIGKFIGDFDALQLNSLMLNYLSKYTNFKATRDENIKKIIKYKV